jgi:hypothetical protein
MAGKSKLFQTEQEKAAETKRVLPMGAKAAIAAGAMGVAAMLGGCDNGTNPKTGPEPKVCECPPGTTHKAGEKCCDGENCACEEEVPPIVCECPEGTFHDEGDACCDGEDCACKMAYNVSLGTKQIRVEDTTGLANRTEIEKAFNWMDINVSANTSVIHFKGMASSPIMVIEGTHNFRVEGSKFFIGIDKLGGDGSDDNSDILNNIFMAIFDIYNYGGAPLMSKVYNKEVIRLANGKTLNVGKLMAFGRQFNDAKNTVRIAFASQRQGLQA